MINRRKTPQRSHRWLPTKCRPPSSRPTSSKGSEATQHSEKLCNLVNEYQKYQARPGRVAWRARERLTGQMHTLVGMSCSGWRNRYENEYIIQF